MKKIIDYAHMMLLNKLNNETVFVDFTLGNGHDSAFFYPKVKQLFAFDIQQQAIQNSLKNYPFLQNASIILDSHHHILQYVSNFDAGIFNLGYLPSGDKTITTLPQTTISAIQNALQILNPNGILVIVVYIGHSQGKIESDELLQYLHTLQNIQITKIQLLNKNTAPYILVLEK